MVLLAAYLLFIAGGFVVGRVVATSNKLAVSAFAACAGALVFAFCCRAASIVILLRRSRRANRREPARPTP